MQNQTNMNKILLFSILILINNFFIKTSGGWNPNGQKKVNVEIAKF